MNKTTYINGDEAEYTGETRTLSGGLFYVVKFTEGRKTGEEAVTMRTPDGCDPWAAAAKADRAEMQAGFSRLAKLSK